MSGLQITWKKMGSEFTYDVMYSRTLEGPWIRDNDFRLTDDIVDKLVRRLENEEENPASAPYNVYEHNVYVIDGLDSDEVYYVKVKCYDKYDQWWYSYDGETSLGGGLSEPHNRPNPSGGNSLGFQFKIETGSSGLGLGPLGNMPLGN